MVNADFLGQLAFSVWFLELGSNPTISPQNISGFFCSSQVVGLFDSMIGACYVASGFTGAGSYNYDVYMPTCENGTGCKLGDTEGAIFRSIYLITYYQQQINNFVGNGSYVSGIYNQSSPLVNLTEGDSKISWSDPARIMAVFKTLLDAERKNLHYIVEEYKINSQGVATPRAVNWYGVAWSNNANTFAPYLS